MKLKFTILAIFIFLIAFSGFAGDLEDCRDSLEDSNKLLEKTLEKIEELETKNEKLEKENKELKAQLSSGDNDEYIKELKDKIASLEKKLKNKDEELEEELKMKEEALKEANNALKNSNKLLEEAYNRISKDQEEIERLRNNVNELITSGVEVKTYNFGISLYGGYPETIGMEVVYNLHWIPKIGVLAGANYDFKNQTPHVTAGLRINLD